MELPLETDQTYSQKRLWFPVFAVMVTLVVSSSCRGAPSGPGFLGFDKVAHFFVFGLLGTLFFRAIKCGFLDPRRCVLAFLGVVAYALVDEGIQYFNPYRTFDYWDWLADALGAMLAILLYRYWGWYRGVLEYNLRRLLAKKGEVSSNPAV